MDGCMRVFVWCSLVAIWIGDADEKARGRVEDVVEWLRGKDMVKFERELLLNWGGVRNERFDRGARIKSESGFLELSA